MNNKQVVRDQKREHAVPEKCADSPLTRADGGIKSTAAAMANEAHRHSAAADLDYVDTCAMNNPNQKGPVAGGPQGKIK
ncbi:MAG: hypothetical protein LBV80_01880 [Deltaproteobacteria bacterium]|jgi:hypothetical protein|nr:hypothetical protein [Deltaproteobacteria bacterium]